MKKVRLFAVAAAMGMFAATVNATGPVVNKVAYKATWGATDEIVRAEIGGKVVLPTASVVVTKEGRTTDIEKALGTVGSFGSLTYTCYEGLTDKVGKDTNGDSLVDYAILTGEKGEGLAPEWYYDNLKFFPSVNTSLYYLGMTSNGLGARFIEPGAAAEKGWIVSSTHTKYAKQDDIINLLVQNGNIELVENAKGEVETVKLNAKEYTVGEGKNKVKVGKAWKEVSATDTRYGIEELAEFVVGQFDGSNPAVTTKAPKYFATPYYAADNETGVTYLDAAAGESLVDQILVVAENRYGELEIDRVEPLKAGDIDAVEGKVIVVIEDAKGNVSKYLTITPAAPTKGAEYEMIWDEVVGSFVKTEKVVALADDVFEGAVATEIKNELDVADQSILGGLYKYDNPANTSDKIVVNFDLGVYNNYSLDIAGINTTKGTITLTDAWDKDFTTSAVKLDGKWYPAVANKAELGEFVRRMAGLATATTDFIAELEAESRYSTVTWLDGTKDTKYIPDHPLAHYKAQQCTYVTATETVDAASVVITSNAASVDTNQYGVHTVTLTAKVGEDVVGTKDVKVVIAPKYVREYKGGKVVSLKAYHLNGNLYSHTTFDYAKNTSSAVFYGQDGVTPTETVTGTIK